MKIPDRAEIVSFAKQTGLSFLKPVGLFLVFLFFLSASAALVVYAFVSLPQNAFFQNIFFPTGEKLLTTLTQLGSFYGGLFGPVITAVGLIFIYNTYRTQLKETERAQINKLYADILDDINSIQYRKRVLTLNLDDTGILFQGVDAIFNYGGKDGFVKDSLLNHVLLIVISFNQLLDKIQCSTLLGKDARIELMSKVCLLCHAKINWPVFDGIYKSHGESLLIHTGFGHLDTMLYHYERLTKRTILHLRAQKLIRIYKPKTPVGPGATQAKTVSQPIGKPLPFLATTMDEIADRPDILIEVWQAAADAWVGKHQAWLKQHPESWARNLVKSVFRAAVNLLPIPVVAKIDIVRESGNLWKV